MSEICDNITCERLTNLRSREGNLVVLTGAGISAESGIPTFRGKDGFWVVGSQVYQPQEMATYAMFTKDREAVWSWYLYRRSLCRQATPNAGHQAVVQMEHLLTDRFRLITQNVDGLHIRAGSSLDRTYQIHGNIDYARCDHGCGQAIWSLSDGLGVDKDKEEGLTDDEIAQLRCPSCGEWGRPHVLWFDEYYDEEHFHYESSLQTATTADVLLVVGTSGATNLPMQIGRRARVSGTFIIDVNVEANPFSEVAQSSGGLFLQGTSGRVLPRLFELMQ